MRSLAFIGFATALVACGDDGTIEPTAKTCDDTAFGSLPAEGIYVDPYALRLPETCVPGGLAMLEGRWFVRDPDEVFAFEYPKYSGSCDEGHRKLDFEDDHVLENDNLTQHTWSDGTRFMTRRYGLFPRGDGEPPYELASVFVACMLQDGTLAARRYAFNTDRGETQYEMIGSRFAQKEAALASGLSLVGEVGTSSAGGPIEGLNVVLDGSHAYVAGISGFDVIDVTDPSAPVAVGHIDGDFNDLRLVKTADASRTVVFAASRGGGGFSGEIVVIIDVTNPAAPAAVGQIDEYSHSLQIATKGSQTLLYLANYSNMVPIFDVTNPLVPVRLGAPLVPGDPGGVHDLTVDGDRIYANNTSAGFVAFDVAPDYTSTLRGSIKTAYSHASTVGVAGGRPIVLHGDEGMSPPDGGAFLRILDGDPASPTFMQELSRYQSRPEVGIHNFELVGDKVYIAYYQDGLRVVDLADPTQPREVAHHNTWNYETERGGPFEGALGLRVRDGLIYVADSQRGLLVFSE